MKGRKRYKQERKFNGKIYILYEVATSKWDLFDKLQKAKRKYKYVRVIDGRIYVRRRK